MFCGAVPMMYAERISTWGQDEADVVVTDGEHRCLAFCHPCSLTEGEEITEPISVLDTDSVTRSDKQAVRVESLSASGKYEHRVVADVFAVVKGKARVGVGGLSFEVYPVPGDVGPGDRVEFTARRLDV